MARKTDPRYIENYFSRQGCVKSGQFFDLHMGSYDSTHSSGTLVALFDFDVKWATRYWRKRFAKPYEYRMDEFLDWLLKKGFAAKVPVQRFDLGNRTPEFKFAYNKVWRTARPLSALSIAERRATNDR